jgi:hypothetical protein
MPERRTVQIKAPIAGKTHSTRFAHGASFSQAIAKIGNAAMRRSELAYFNKQMLIHELIRGSFTETNQQLNPIAGKDSLNRNR